MHPTPEPGTDPGLYTRVVRRGWRPIVAMALLGIIAGLALALLAPRTYAATAAVLVTTTGADETTSVGERTIGGEVNLDTEARLLTSAEVLQGVTARTGTRADPTTLAAAVSVEVPANTTVLEITYRANTPELARDGARAFASAYLDNRRNQAQETLGQLSSSYDRQLSSAQREQDQLQASLRSRPAGPAAELVQTRLQAVGARIVTLTEDIVSVDSTVVTPGRVINEPRLPGHASSPKRRLLVLSGAALGLLLGLAIAVHGERSRPQLRTEEDVHRELSLPVMGRLRPGAKGALSLVAPPGSALSVTFRQLRRRCEQLAPGADRVVVVSVSSAAAGLHTGANLAWQHARRGVPARLVLVAGSAPPGVDPRPAAHRPGASVGELRCAGELSTPAAISVLTLDGQPEDAALEPATPGSVTVVDAGAGVRLIDLLTRPGDVAIVLVDQRRDRAPEVQRVLEVLHGCAVQVLGVVLHQGYDGVLRWVAPTGSPTEPEAPADASRAPLAVPVMAASRRTDPWARLAVRRLRSAASPQRSRPRAPHRLLRRARRAGRGLGPQGTSA